MRILFVGDVVGEPGRKVLRLGLRRLKIEHAPDLVIANGENVAGGAGLSPVTVDEMFRAGCDVITTGNHVWDRKEIVPYLERHDRVLRPLNYPSPAPGRGSCIVTARNGTKVCVLNLMGRVFMPALDDPFRAADEFLDALPDPKPPVVVDFHAEATSEKIALAWYLDGRVAAVLGTHTHVQTADERVLPRGTAAITDVGMTGPFDSVIGVEKEDVLERFLTQRPRRLRTAEGDPRLNAVLLTISPATGRAESIARIALGEDEAGALP
jgi:metallophosphoesterase (TIGR00282 family)